MGLFGFDAIQQTKSASGQMNAGDVGDVGVGGIGVGGIGVDGLLYLDILLLLWAFPIAV